MLMFSCNNAQLLHEVIQRTPLTWKMGSIRTGGLDTVSWSSESSDNSDREV